MGNILNACCYELDPLRFINIGIYYIILCLCFRVIVINYCYK